MSIKEDLNYCIDTLNLILGWNGFKEDEILKLLKAIELLKELEVLK